MSVINVHVVKQMGREQFDGMKWDIFFFAAGIVVASIFWVSR